MNYLVGCYPPTIKHLLNIFPFLYHNVMHYDIVSYNLNSILLWINIIGLGSRLAAYISLLQKEYNILSHSNSLMHMKNKTRTHLFFQISFFPLNFIIFIYLFFLFLRLSPFCLSTYITLTLTLHSFC
jgi:hypothetical protein